MSSPPTEYRYPCENCGASLRFRPGQQALICDYCGHRQRIGEGAVGDAAIVIAPPAGRALQWDAGHKSPELVELPLEQGLHLDSTSDLAEETRSLACPNCGARIQMAGASHASACPFCATPVVADTGAARRIKPQGLLPFLLSEAQAHAAMEDWLGRLWFAPSGLVAYARRGRKMRGIYTPYWTFDARTRSAYSGQRGDAYHETVYVTRQVNGRSQRVAQQVRRIRWRAASGHVARDFNDVLVLASASLPRRFSDGLTPWDLSHLRPYRPGYLSGFEAEGYTIPLSDGHGTARQHMAAVIHNDARRDIGGDEQRVAQIRTEYSNETFKHVLLPVWTAAYRYNGKSYRFLVNGQSGRVLGDRPWSVWKIAAAIAVALVALAVFLYFAHAAGYIQLDAGVPPGAGIPGADHVIQGY
ncbi:zinc ribbon domain-containing protein [Paracoccus salsus]|uniref:zinc ribbon domain-containing protein n=1 Tax=Paracoccus salsus TaxID=2911061 RepID=UPI001F197FF2|nr:zinc ribbon domain-containing protein [Paracoccus salsus]MCF3972465.1 zinc ribbon domain-containing protein [Paracoccus salsus]